ncbi:MAG: response regulator [Thermoguttaceae bacterium]|jgi:two-component system response regulator
MTEKAILLAEDDPMQVTLFLRAMEQSGTRCRVDVVRDGAEVIDFLFCLGKYKSGRQMPDLLLLDLKMPKMDGLQVLQVMRRVRGEERGRFPPVVVLTSSDLDDDIVEAYRWGAQSYIRKPLDFEAFCTVVRETLHYWLGLNQPLPALREGHYVHERL